MTVKYSFRHIRRSPYQAISALLIMIITFFMVSLFTMIAFVSSAILQHFETKPQVSAFYPNDTPEEEILQIQKQIKDTGLAKEVRYISSKDAVEIYKKNTNLDDIDQNLDLVSEKILPPSLEITAWKLDDLKSLKSIVEKKEGVKVVFVEEIVNKLGGWLRGLRMGGIVLLGLLCIESILVIWTIIGMRISQRRHEIEIMHLLGATNWYIKSPFLIEGMLYGIIGSVIGVSATIALFNSMLNGLTAFLNGIPILPLTFMSFIQVSFNTAAQAGIDGVPIAPISPLFILGFIAIQCAIGAIIGLIGSNAAFGRNFKK